MINRLARHSKRKNLIFLRKFIYFILYSSRLKQGEKLSSQLKADHMQRIIVRFAIKDQNNKHVQVHQAFVRFTNINTGSQSVFVAELDSQNNYKLDMVCHISKNCN